MHQDGDMSLLLDIRDLHIRFGATAAVPARGADVANGSRAATGDGGAVIEVRLLGRNDVQEQVLEETKVKITDWSQPGCERD